MNKIFYSLIAVLVSIILLGTREVEVIAGSSTNNINMRTSSINISDAFGSYQSAVDRNIYNSLCCIDANILVDIYGDVN